MNARLRLDDVPCPVCGGSHSDEIYPDELAGEAPPVDYAFTPRTRLTFRIVQCRACGHRYTNPMPRLAGLYEDVEDAIYLKNADQHRETARILIERIVSAEPNGPLLDVGCATGELLDAAAEAGYETHGIELSRWAADITERRHPVERETLSRLADRPELRGRFGVATMMGVIEHIEDPLTELRSLHGMMRPGGVAYFYTGDYRAWLPRLLGKRWWWYQGMHIQYFSAASLARLLRRAGFEPLPALRHTVVFRAASIANSLGRYRLLGPLAKHLFRPLDPILGFVPLKLSGEMLMPARAASQPPERI
jgi:SAM-dependent methyltransferase